MGVPGFFAWILKKIKNNKIITNNLPNKATNFYIDANCAFHPQCYKVLHFYNKINNLEKLEKKMIDRNLNYLNYLIQLVNPQKEVFISVDGVAPLAKLNQQRKRRYKSVQDNELKEIINKKYNKETNKIWNNLSITPGTKFMEKLHKKLVEFIKTNKLKLEIDYIYSSYHTIGEGEHKILQDIKKKNIKENEDDIYVIYGLDADLFFLAMSSNKKNIYLLREESFLRKGKKEENEIIDIINDVAEDLCYVSIDETKKSINKLIKDCIKRKGFQEYIEDIDFIDDFITLSYLLGNDFIPHIPSIDIKNNGLDFLIDKYTNTFILLNTHLIKKDRINNKIEINGIFLEELLESLSKCETYYFEVKLPQFKEGLNRRKCLSEDPYDIEMWELDNMRSSGNNEDSIQLGMGSPDLWKFRYYEYYYKATHSQKELIDKMCLEYLKSVLWSTKYYFEECKIWDWQYPYFHAPFISDIWKYYRNNNIDINHLQFNGKSESLTPLVQLLSVIPPVCVDLLPKEYYKIMISVESSVKDLFPIKVHIDTINKDSYWKCIPMVPNININRIINAVKTLNLSTEENIRNKIFDNFIATYRKRE